MREQLLQAIQELEYEFLLEECEEYAVAVHVGRPMQDGHSDRGKVVLSLSRRNLTIFHMLHGVIYQFPAHHHVSHELVDLGADLNLTFSTNQQFSINMMGHHWWEGTFHITSMSDGFLRLLAEYHEEARKQRAEHEVEALERQLASARERAQ